MLTVIETILEKEKITRFSREDLTPFIYAMNGDIRRAITEIQAAKSSNSTLQKQVEVSLEDYTKILMKIVNKNSNVLYDVHNLLYEGQTVKEVCIGLHEAVINADGLDSNTKFKFLRTIGESEYRSQTMTPKLLLSWLVGQLL
tara:strand:- start:312 stop:740 length:429 start_codon:yes stop_codon:yes gene_type:complete